MVERAKDAAAGLAALDDLDLIQQPARGFSVVMSDRDVFSVEGRTKRHTPFYAARNNFLTAVTQRLELWSTTR